MKLELDLYASKVTKGRRVFSVGQTEGKVLLALINGPRTSVELIDITGSTRACIYTSICTLRGKLKKVQEHLDKSGELYSLRNKFTVFPS